MNKDKMNTIFGKIIMGAWFLIEKHQCGCTCSYCEEERNLDKKFRVVLPKCKSANTWSRISVKRPDGYLYIRSTLMKLSYFLGFVFTKWTTGFRLTLIPSPIHRTNDCRGLITICKGSPFTTKFKNIECLFWKTQIRYSNSPANGVCIKTSMM